MDRLPMHAYPASHFGLRNTLTQESCSLHAPLFELRKISAYSCWIAHAGTVAQIPENVTILCEINKDFWKSFSYVLFGLGWGIGLLAKWGGAKEEDNDYLERG